MPPERVELGIAVPCNPKGPSTDVMRTLGFYNYRELLERLSPYLGPWTTKGQLIQRCILGAVQEGTQNPSFVAKRPEVRWLQFLGLNLSSCVA